MSEASNNVILPQTVELPVEKEARSYILSFLCLFSRFITRNLLNRYGGGFISLTVVLLLP